MALTGHASRGWLHGEYRVVAGLGECGLPPSRANCRHNLNYYALMADGVLFLLVHHSVMAIKAAQCIPAFFGVFEFLAARIELVQIGTTPFGNNEMA